MLLTTRSNFLLGQYRLAPVLMLEGGERRRVLRLIMLYYVHHLFTEALRMNDPHVVALLYNVKHKKSVDYSKAEPLEREEEDFTIKVENDKACFTMKAPPATEEEAREAVKDYIEAWEIHAALQRGLNAFTLEFADSKIEDRPGDTVAPNAHSPHPMSEAELCVTHPYSSYPSPPSGMKIDADVRSMFDRWAGHHLEKEPLASMAYFLPDYP